MAYKRSFTITVDSAENILNEEANAIFDEWVNSGKILNSGSNVDPEDSNNIITWVTFNNEAECNQYFTAISGKMTNGVDDTHFTIVETTNEYV